MTFNGSGPSFFRESTSINLAVSAASLVKIVGILYFKMGRKDQAKRQWEQAQQANPNDLSARAFCKISRDWPAEHIQ